ncbi:MAG: phosphotransferase [Patescibacteria group bacterium]
MRKEYQKISDLYNLGLIKNVACLRQGLIVPKAVIETPKGKFIVSQHKLSNKKNIISKSETSLRYEISLLGTLKDLPVPHYLKSVNNKFIEKFGDRWLTVNKYIEGKNPKTITPAMARQLGSFLGSFHRKGRNFKKIIKQRRKFYDLNPKVMREMHSSVKRQKNKKLRAVVEEVKAGVIENFPPPKLPTGPIHVDIKPENELFFKGKLTGIVDFGNFYIGTLMVDLGKTIMWNCCRNKKIDKKLLKEFIKGYGSKRKLGLKETLYLKKSILYAIYSHIWVDLYHIPFKYVPESYVLSLVNNFLPVARKIILEAK